MYMFYTNIALIILAAHKAKIQFKIYVLGHKILYLNQLTYFRFLLTPCVSKYCSRGTDTLVSVQTWFDELAVV